AGAVMMHMRGTPRTMQDDPQYGDLFGEIIQYLKKSVAIATAAGIAPGKMIVDPGIGFGKTSEHNLELLRHFERFQKLGKPVLLGASRKSFIGNVLGLPVEERLEGSLAVAAIGVLKGARVLRVHDVKETVRAVKMARAIMGPNEENK
ncbi:MAG: dihydropteroate synthase, partial [Nitrospinae bacterium]|nr:dihydropteroate synthase [Nitrospinota bacterium]